MILLIILPFLIGFISFLTPTGPITILIFRNTLLGKYGKAVMIIFGATIVQFFFSSISLYLISNILPKSLISLSRALSSVVFLVLGIHLIFSKPKKSDQIIHLKNLPHIEKLKSLSTGIFVTLFNPAIIFSWLAIITLLISFNYIAITNILDIGIFTTSATIGILSGSFLMMFLVHHFRNIFSNDSIKKILKFLGVAVIILGLYFLFTAISL